MKTNGKKLFREIIETIFLGGCIRVNDNIVSIVNQGEWSDNPENEVLCLGFVDGDFSDEDYVERINEDDLNNAVIENGNIVIAGVPKEAYENTYSDVDIVISLYRKYFPRLG